MDHYSFAFYNVENLFDTINDPLTLDDDFTASSDKNWTNKRYRKKLKKLGKTIAHIGLDNIGFPPVIVGLAEVENRTVLEDLIKTKHLKKKGYGLVHRDSPDERGIDNALLYRKDYFHVESYTNHLVYITNELGERDYTRDVLHITGSLLGHRMHILVNHWPSRRQGTEETENKRITAAKKNVEIIQNIHKEDPNARIVVMGDFNDDPNSTSISLLIESGLYNPMEPLLTLDEGSLSYHQQWHLFDQIMVSHNFLKLHDNPFQFDTAVIYHPRELQEYSGKYEGTPFRTYVGKKYLGGVSDHFPVYTVFTLEK